MKCKVRDMGGRHGAWLTYGCTRDQRLLLAGPPVVTGNKKAPCARKAYPLPLKAAFEVYESM